MRTLSKEALQEFMLELDNVQSCLPDNQTIDAQDDNAMAHMEVLLDNCNDALQDSKSDHNIRAVLLGDPNFAKKLSQIEDLAATVDIEKLDAMSKSFIAKYADFLVNQHKYEVACRAFLHEPMLNTDEEIEENISEAFFFDEDIFEMDEFPREAETPMVPPNSPNFVPSFDKKKKIVRFKVDEPDSSADENPSLSLPGLSG